MRFSRDVLTAYWRFRGDRVEFWIEADAFMRHMNRVLVGTMLEVAFRPPVGGFVRGAAGRAAALGGGRDGAGVRAVSGGGRVSGERVLGDG